MRVLHFARTCYFDDANGAAIASRALLQALARQGVAVEAVCGSMLDADVDVEIRRWISERGWSAEAGIDESWSVDAAGTSQSLVPRCELSVRGVAVTLIPGETKLHQPSREEFEDFLLVVREKLDRFCPQILLGYHGDELTKAVFQLAASRGVATCFHLHNFSYRDPAPLAACDRIVVPSHFSASYHLAAFGLECTPIPNPVDLDRVRVESREGRYLTFVNPSIEKGVYAFARIADELGRRRPDIPILVVESRGTEETVASCGIDLKRYGTVFFMANTTDPKQFWRVTRACLMPSLWWESQGMVAVEAIVNGIPVFASDRGALPETLGSSGVVLPLPEWLTPATRWVPSAEEVAPWVESIIRLWDDANWYKEKSRLSLIEAQRWKPEVLDRRLLEFFQEILDGHRPAGIVSPHRKKSVVLVPHLSGIEWECEESLRKLEEAGVSVVRSRGSSQIDVARNRMASDALHDGFESILFIDADIGFDPTDAFRLLARPESVVSGVYAKKGRREMASLFSDGLSDIEFGASAAGLYPLKYAATGFLRIRASAFRRMIDQLDLPLCNTKWGRGIWPFFQPICVPDGESGQHYLGEDWAFSHRLSQIGVTPLADTSIRLWHYGQHPFGWEDAGEDRKRYASYRFHTTPRMRRDDECGP